MSVSSCVFTLEQPCSYGCLVHARDVLVNQHISIGGVPLNEWNGFYFIFLLQRSTLIGCQVGSGFDVCSAVFGSCVFTRLAPSGKRKLVELATILSLVELAAIVSGGASGYIVSCRASDYSVTCGDSEHSLWWS